MISENIFKKIQTKSFYDECNLLGKFLHFYNWRFFLKNYKKKVELISIPQCSTEDTSNFSTEKLDYYWQKQLNKKKPSLLWSMFCLYKKKIILIIIFCLLGQLSLLVQAIFMGNIVKNARNLNKNPSLKSNLVLNSIMMVLCQFLYVQFMNLNNSLSLKTGCNFKISLSGLIYKKSLNLNKYEFSKTSSGQIINLMTNDVKTLERFLQFLAYPLVSFVIVIAGTIYLYPYLNHYVFYGVSIILLVIPFQIAMGKLFGKLKSEGSKLSDERIKLMNEFVSAIRLIKMYAWENEFVKKINGVRKKEITKIKSAAYKFSLNIGLFFVTSKIVIYITLVSYVLAGNSLNAEKVFIGYAILNKMSYICTLYIPHFVHQTANSLVCFKRIQDFLFLKEVDKDETSDDFTKLYKKESQLVVSNLFCSYVVFQKEHQKYISDDNFNPSNNELKENFDSIIKNGKNFDVVLKNINFKCQSKGLNIIIGPVGSGKSTILLSILKETYICHGDIEIKGKISYSSQESWTFGGTIKENILFNSPYEEQKYKKVIQVCSLEIDFVSFPLGDETVVGEKGVSLSGGQKSRISLARALYLDADVNLLDDPLSAVDPHVASHIFKHAIQEYLKEKIIVLVTHQLQFIQNADNILFLKEGKQIAFDNYSNLLQVKEFSNFIGFEERQEKKFSKNENDDCIKEKKPIFSSNFLSDKTFLKKTNNLVKEETKNEVLKQSSTESSFKNTYWVYIKFGLKGWIGPVLILTFVIAEFTFSFSDYFLSLWTSSEEKHNEKLNEVKTVSFVDNLTTLQSIYVYTFLMCFLFFLSISKAMLFFKSCMKSSVKLHNRLFKSVVCAPMSFFDNNPIGVLLNRCSRDMGIIDESLPTSCFETLDVALTDLSIAIMVIIINPFLIFPFVLLVILVCTFRRFYIESAKSVRLCEGMIKSPVLQHVSSTLNGLVTIRAFGFRNTYKNTFDMYQNDHSSVYFQFFLGSRFFVYVLDSLQLIFMAGVLSVIIIFVDHLDCSTIGLIISTCLIFCSQFQLMVKDFAEVEQQILSVFQVNEYSKLPKEKNLFKKNEKLLSLEQINVDVNNWPSNGKITFENLILSYNENEDPVLKNLTFSVESCDKIGIVGRTGAGKSSIITAIYRMTDYSGSIKIDDIDTKFFTLHDLRKKISIIPQDPILFSGTIRSNLDPFNEYSDFEVKKSIKEVNLDKTVNFELNLDLVISDQGSNFSVGQKQLICLARAILRKNKVLILDEATANCDPQTDELIQQTIRSAFKNCTILTIAHRLNTIMDSDKILVLDAGNIIEYDTPKNLKLDPNSRFNSMIKATGK